MSYQYPTATLVTEIQHRLNDLRAAPLEARWTEATIRKAIKDALRWADPVGEYRVLTMTAAQYLAAVQPDYDVIDIVKVEVATTRGYHKLPDSLWHCERGQNAWLTLAHPPTTETLRISAYVRPDLSGITDLVLGSYPTTYIRIDPTMIQWCAMGLLLQRDTRSGAPGQTLTDEAHSLDFRTQAEQRRLSEISKQARDSNEMPPDDEPKRSSRKKRS